LARALLEGLSSRVEAARVDADDAPALVDALAHPELAGVIHLAPESSEPPELRATLGPASRLAQSLLARSVPLTLVTRGAQRVGEADAIPATALAGASLWGLGRTLAEEAPSLRCRMIDLDPALDDAQAVLTLLAELARVDDERQVCLRGEHRLVARLVRALDGRLTRPQGAASWVLVQRTHGELDSLALAAVERPRPGPGQVEITVEAAGLNFRDVLGALGMLGELAAPLGGELAGRVTAVGEGVTRLSVGDPVMGLAPSSFGRHVVTDARLVVRRPRSLDLHPCDAATIPVAFLTAWHALYELAALRPGERVLVHAAAGGVGMAAVQLARRIGAEVHGTASRGKQAAVRALGAAHVTSSREPGFAAEILQHTAGAGVDVVLNSLTGELLRESFAALGERGRFIEIGKLEPWSEAQVRQVHPSASYQAFDLLELPPERIAGMLDAIVAALEAGEITPLPRRTFALSEAVQAFRTMARAQHVGKIVLTVEELEVALAPLGTWLVTGGLGALGRHVAGTLVERGARHLVLVARQPPSGERAAFVERLRAAGARVEVAIADVSRRREVEALIESIAETRPPLVGVVHAAGVLDDGLLAEQSWSRFVEVLGPKASGAWWLHEATKALPLQAFVLFSSVVGSLGSAGQSSYAAANAFLDGLAHHRRGAGLAGVSIGWGPWAGEGMAGRLGARQQQRLASAGLRAIEPAQGLRWLVRLLRSDAPHVIVAPLDRSRLTARIGAGPVPPLLSRLVEARTTQAGPSLTERLARLAPTDRHRKLVELLRERAAAVMGAASADVDPRTPLLDLGLDSLMAVDLQHALARDVDRPLPETLLFDHPTLERLATHLLDDVLGMAPPPEPAPEREDGLEELSEDEAAAVLAHELRQIEGLL
jgi:NADPH:quinone reductase-like Zn-dependent oxidoreductase/NAD(P)-dependent dehydrogenase (short-subunit alcohol dehydrogenase family)/aryl carrier-like protein